MAGITFPVGRLVWGSMYVPRTKDFDGKPLLIKSGPQAGQPTQRYEFGVAIPKVTQYWQQTPWGQAIYNEGIASFTRGEPQRPDFAWKVTDGDSQVPNKNNRRPCDQEGHPGHWVVTFSSTYPPKLFNRDGTQALVEPDAIKCGYYVEVYGSIAGNGTPTNPGVFINHEMVALSGFGEVIHTGADPKAVGFGQSALPAGASAVPVGGFNPAAPQGNFTPPQGNFQPPAAQPNYNPNTQPAQYQQQRQPQHPVPQGQPQYQQQPAQYVAPVTQQPQYTPPANQAPQHIPQQGGYAPPQQNYVPPQGQPQYTPPTGQPQGQFAHPGVNPVPSFLQGPQ